MLRELYLLGKGILGTLPIPERPVLSFRRCHLVMGFFLMLSAVSHVLPSLMMKSKRK
jgi:hypothetical protein